jgi:hypothetical protein
MVFAHHTKGRGRNSQAALTRLAATEKNGGVMSIINRFLGSFDANMSGIRFGQQILRPKNAYGNSPMLSVFSEIRSGPLSGLRFYYDKAPESNFVTEDGNQGYWGWSSLSLGWSFATPLPKFVKPILSQFDIYPKIGYLNLASRMTARDLDGNFYPIDLKIDKKLLLGLELGAEHPWYPNIFINFKV